MAANAWADDVNPTSELRILSRLNLQLDDHAELRDRYFHLLLDTDQKTLLAQTSSSNEAYADAAANYIFLHSTQPIVYAAIDARAHPRAPVWGAATTALAGLFYADKSPRIEASFHTALADATIGERLTHPADRNQQIAGNDWFYYAMRYGVYRTINPVPTQDPEDFLPANLEANSSSAASYIALAEAYRDAGQPESAVREYHHALELTPRTAAIHRAIAVTLWPTDKPTTDKTEATDQWKAALSLLRALVDVRAVPESFWSDFATIATDLHARNLGQQFQPQRDAVLRAYITKNGDYRSAELLQSAFTTQPTDAGVDWIFSLASAARNPVPLFNQLDAPWFPRNQLGRLYRRQLELAENAATAQASATSGDNNFSAGDVAQARIKLLNWLLQQKNDAEAQTLYNSIPAAQRQQDAFQQIRIELAARQHQIPALLADFTADPITAPSLDLIKAAANRLRTEGDQPSNRLLLEYVFQQKFERYQLTPTDFLALAQARLDANTAADTTSAIDLLHRLIMLPANGDQDLYANLDSAASLLENSDHATEALPFLTTLSNATPWNSSYRLRLAQAQLKTQQNTAARTTLAAIASTSTAPYELRTQAATTLHSIPNAPPTPKTFDSVELTLLASNAPISAQQANQPYFLPARIAAARTATPEARPAILHEAIAVAPSDNLRLALFRAEFALNHNELALVAVRPLLESPGGYAHSANQSDDSPSIPQDSDTTQPTDSQIIDDQSNANSGRPLPILLRTREEKITFALDIATLYEKNGDAPQAAAYLSTAATLNQDPTRAKAIANRLAAAQTRIRIDSENSRRRPVIQPTLNQAVVVRPQITLAAAKQVQP